MGTPVKLLTHALHTSERGRHTFFCMGENEKEKVRLLRHRLISQFPLLSVGCCYFFRTHAE